MNEKRIGVYVQLNELRIIEIEKSPNAYRVNALQEISFPHPLPLSINEQNGGTNLGLLIDALKTSFGSRYFKSKIVSFALDTRSAFIHTFPFNKNTPEKEINKIINWELKQYFPDADPELFRTNLYIPPQSTNTPNMVDCIYISVLENHFKALEKEIQSLGLSVSSINVDIFSIGYLLKVFKPYGRKEPFYTIFSHKNNILYCAIFWHSKLIKYREFPVSENLFPREKMLSFLESSLLLSKDISLRVFYHTINDINELNRKLDKNIVLEELDPFIQQKLSWRARRILNRKVSDRGSFAPAVGAALSDLV